VERKKSKLLQLQKKQRKGNILQQIVCESKKESHIFLF